MCARFFGPIHPPSEEELQVMTRRAIACNMFMDQIGLPQQVYPGPQALGGEPPKPPTVESRPEPKDLKDFPELIWEEPK